MRRLLALARLSVGIGFPLAASAQEAPDWATRFAIGADVLLLRPSAPLTSAIDGSAGVEAYALVPLGERPWLRLRPSAFYVPQGEEGFGSGGAPRYERSLAGAGLALQVGPGQGPLRPYAALGVTLAVSGAREIPDPACGQACEGNQLTRDTRALLSPALNAGLYVRVLQWRGVPALLHLGASDRGVAVPEQTESGESGPSTVRGRLRALHVGITLGGGA